jgi:TetR/AcrR family transcriptional regulator of autoinduction and epiphytic fitness
MERRKGSMKAAPNARRAGSRDAIVGAAERLFLDRGFGSVSMDELAEAAGVARRTLYNQFAGKEEIFRAMLLRCRASSRTRSARHRNAWRRRGRAPCDRRVILNSTSTGIPRVPPHGFADSRQFWIAKEFAAVMEPQPRGSRAISPI